MRPWIAAMAALFASSAAAAPAPVSAYMGQAPVKADVRIVYGDAPGQVIDLFLPKGRGPFPVVILLHGGCYLAEYQGLTQTSPIAADLARRGYAVWNVDYRKLGEAGAGYPGTFQDVADAIDRVGVEAARYHLDTGRVVALGHSAGGHLALWAAGRRNIPRDSALWRADPLAIKAVVSLGGIGDLEGQGEVFAGACGQVIPRVIDVASRKTPYGDTSPTELLPLRASVTMISGEFDHVMPPVTGRVFVERLRAAGDRAEAVSIPGAGHYDVVIPTTAAWKVVVGILARSIPAKP